MSRKFKNHKFINYKFIFCFCAIVLAVGIALDFGMADFFMGKVSGLDNRPANRPADRLDDRPGDRLGRFSQAVPVSEQEMDESGGYHLSFALDKEPRGVINCYMVKYRPENLELAWKYARIFTEVTDFTENEEKYIFTGVQGTVSMDKEINRIHFEAVQPMGGVSASGLSTSLLTSDEEAIDCALSFIGNRLLVLFYEEAQVCFDGDLYRVLFINRISNLKNYAFANEILLDQYGNILSLDYYTIQYEKVGGCHIKSMSGAYEELPPLPENETVLLKSCQLVYIYQDSIVQPAYYFQGSATNDKTYECFIEAAVF
ncbi:MAG: hypothetical protein LBT44_06045 [Clostridiales bacterium]|jgi:hypothetical protein|nr:hypothetical protein [Clostridiales bacterium]